MTTDDAKAIVEALDGLRLAVSIGFAATHLIIGAMTIIIITTRRRK